MLSLPASSKPSFPIIFKGYAADRFYDEMFSADGSVRDFCKPLHSKFKDIEKDDFLSRKATSELYFMRQGITFKVYRDNQEILKDGVRAAHTRLLQQRLFRALLSRQENGHRDRRGTRVAKWRSMFRGKVVIPPFIRVDPSQLR